MIKWNKIYIDLVNFFSSFGRIVSLVETLFPFCYSFSTDLTRTSLYLFCLLFFFFFWGDGKGNKGSGEMWGKGDLVCINLFASNGKSICIPTNLHGRGGVFVDWWWNGLSPSVLDHLSASIIGTIITHQPSTPTLVFSQTNCTIISAAFIKNQTQMMGKKKQEKEKEYYQRFIFIFATKYSYSTSQGIISYIRSFAFVKIAVTWSLPPKFIFPPYNTQNWRHLFQITLCIFWNCKTRNTDLVPPVCAHSLPLSFSYLCMIKKKTLWIIYIRTFFSPPNVNYAMLSKDLEFPFICSYWTYIYCTQ